MSDSTKPKSLLALNSHAYLHGLVAIEELLTYSRHCAKEQGKIDLLNSVEKLLAKWGYRRIAAVALPREDIP